MNTQQDPVRYFNYMLKDAMDGYEFDMGKLNQAVQFMNNKQIQSARIRLAQVATLLNGAVNNELL